MKKILSLVLCILISLFCLVGCAEDIIGDYLKNYPEINDEIEEITLNVYIICGEGTKSIAIDTVEQKLSQYSKEKFNTILNMEYVTESEYAAKINEKTAPNAENRADIILVNSADMMEALVADGRVEDLTSFFNSGEFGNLNVQIAETIIASAKIDNKLYCVPNNHVVGEYEYLLIDKNVANGFYYSPEMVKAMTTYEATQALRNDLLTSNPTANVDDYVRVVSGSYTDKAAYEAQGYYCNVVKYPTVDKYEALSSSFAVVKGTKDAARCMEIIYAFNTNEDFRNTLQYGVEGANYTRDEVTGVVTRVSTGDSVYIMDIKHTGNVFAAYPCDEISWTKAAIEAGKMQNSESVIG